MSEAGFDIIKNAKENSSWFILDDAETLIIPNDLNDEFAKRPDAKITF